MTEPLAEELYVSKGGTPADPVTEMARTKNLAQRYRLEYIDMKHFVIDQGLFRSIPADLMLRYGFVPHRREGRSLVIVVSDPDRRAEARRASAPAWLSHYGHRRDAVGHRVDSREERRVPAGAGRSN